MHRRDYFLNMHAKIYLGVFKKKGWMYMISGFYEEYSPLVLYGLFVLVCYDVMK